MDVVLNTITRKHLETLHDALPASFRRQEEKSSNVGPSVESGPSPLQSKVDTLS